MATSDIHLSKLIIGVYNDLTLADQEKVRKEFITHCYSTVNHAQLHEELLWFCPIVYTDYGVSLHTIDCVKKLLKIN